MRGEDLKPVLALLAGLWPSPEMTREEVMAWTGELAGRQEITPEEAMTVLARFAESGIGSSKFRPGAGQIVPMVRELRRKRTLDQPLPALPSGNEICTPEQVREHCARIRIEAGCRLGNNPA
jgi:hypothetical protein